MDLFFIILFLLTAAHDIDVTTTVKISYPEPQILLALVALITLVVMVVGDIYYITGTLSSVSDERASGQWDLLSLTSIDRSQILLGKCAVAQVRAWPMVMAEIGLRIALLSILVLFVLLPSNYISDKQSFFSRWVDQYSMIGMLAKSISTQFVETLLLLIGVLVVVIGYLVEPIWRERALGSIGLLLSAGRQPETIRMIIAASTAWGIQIIQIISLVVLNVRCLSYLPVVGPNLNGLPPSESTSPIVISFMIAALCTLNVIVLGFVDLAIQRLARKVTLHVAFRPY